MLRVPAHRVERARFPAIDFHTHLSWSGRFGEELYEIYFRFLETEDEYFDYAPAPKPPQGRWRIYGLGLPGTILKKIYYENAARLLGLSA
jgi:hypothetical protein